jgi:hypothetical protein
MVWLENDENTFGLVISRDKYTSHVGSEFSIHSFRVWENEEPVQYLQQVLTSPKITLLSALGWTNVQDFFYFYRLHPVD